MAFSRAISVQSEAIRLMISRPRDELCSLFGMEKKAVKMAHNLLSLPHEVLHSIIIQVDPQDVASLCCCRALNNYIKNNRLLFKELYIAHFVSNPRNSLHDKRQMYLQSGQDEPPRSSKDAELAWGIELPKLVKAQKILESENVNVKVRELVIRRRKQPLTHLKA